jgi:hypothetical protein
VRLSILAATAVPTAGLGRDLRLRPAAALQQANRFAFRIGRELSSRLRHPTPFPLNMSVSKVPAKPREHHLSISMLPGAFKRSQLVAVIKST